LQEFLARDLGVESLPEVLSSPVIQDLKSRLSAAEARLSQASNTLGVNHPDYQRVQAEVDSLRRKLRDEIRTAAAVIGNNLRITQGRERELREAVAAQKARLLEINRHRDQLGVMMKEVENAQKAYDSAAQRHTQTTLESRMDRGTVSVLSEAIPPIKPSFPKMPLVAAFSVLIGLMLGVGSALAVEMVDRRVRGIEDLVQATGVQIWGVLGNTAAIIRDVERRKRVFLRKPRMLTPMREPHLE
jgi:succinoglycan biosynthesis transport protein ExoP